MDKRKYPRISGHKKSRIGTLLGIHDKNGVELKVGDFIKYNGEDCIVLFSGVAFVACLLYSKWYGDETYNHHSYGKARPLPMDNGAKMHIEITRTER